MIKKLICTTLVFSIISVFGMTAFAAPTDSPAATPTATPQATYEKEVVMSDDLTDILMEDKKETKPLLVTITMPDFASVSVAKKSYVISGVSDSSDAIVVLQVYDDDTERYVPLENTDGESTWEIGSFGVFSKEIELKKGSNKIRIQAYNKSKEDTLQIEDIQVNHYTIYLNSEGIKGIINNVVDFTEKLGSELGDIFKSKIR